MEAMEKNLTLFQDLIGWQVVGVEKFDGRLLVLFTNGEDTAGLEIDRFAKIKGKR